MVTIKCWDCGKLVDIPIDPYVYAVWENTPKRIRPYACVAFPNVTLDEREMIITKTCTKCFDIIMAPTDEDTTD